VSALHVICQIDGAAYAIPAEDVLQMESFETSTPVPGAPAFVKGLTQVRQQIVPVIDTRVRFGLTPTLVTSDSRLVVLKLGKRLVGLLVESAREVLMIAPDSFAPAPEMAARQATAFIKAIANTKGKVILLIDSLKVAGEDSSHG
jgi:purine-binding chemotaxis protein CheW